MTSLGSLGSDPLKPSIFEYVSQKKLNVLFNPALKYILTVIHTLSSYLFTYRNCRFMLKDTPEHY